MSLDFVVLLGLVTLLVCHLVPPSGRFITG
jgi:hypothetical protein